MEDEEEENDYDDNSFLIPSTISNFSLLLPTSHIIKLIMFIKSFKYSEETYLSLKLDMFPKSEITLTTDTISLWEIEFDVPLPLHPAYL